MAGESEFLQGTLDLLVLQALARGSLHGYAVARWIHQRTGEVILVEEGALYPALHRLEKRGLLEAEWGLSDSNRRARFYQLTARGRRELRAETNAWLRFSQGVSRALEVG
jgi:transcriptional regulator